MSKIGGRDAGTLRPDRPEREVGDAPRARWDGRADRPSQGLSKGPGGRDARLGSRAGHDGRGATDPRAGGAAESFERSLEQALEQEAGGWDGTDSHRHDDEHPGEPRADDPAAALVPGVMGRFQGLGQSAADQSPPAPAIGSHGRRAALSSLWAQDDAPTSAAQRTEALATPAEAGPDDTAERAAPLPRGGARRLLAEVEAQDPALMSAAAQAGPVAMQAGTSARSGAATPGEAGPGAGERAARVAETVERAIRAEDTPAPGQVVSLDIPLDPLKDGLGAVTVTLAPDSIEVVLAHAGAVASADLRASAQALADRLQRRFPSRAVRVFEEPGRTAPADRSDAPGQGST